MSLSKWLQDFSANADQCHAAGFGIWSSLRGGIHFAEHNRKARNERMARERAESEIQHMRLMQSVQQSTDETEGVL